MWMHSLRPECEHPNVCTVKMFLVYTLKESPKHDNDFIQPGCDPGNSKVATTAVVSCYLKSSCGRSKRALSSMEPSKTALHKMSAVCIDDEPSLMETIQRLFRKRGFLKGIAQKISQCLLQSSTQWHQGKWTVLCEWYNRRHQFFSSCRLFSR